MAGKELEDPYATKVAGLNVFDPRVVAQLHRNADTDNDKTSTHHTIGPGPNQAASGVHVHDGSETRQLGAGVTLTGAKAGNAAVASMVAAMVQILGVTDNTT
jgi:hypothetical protein